MDEKNPKIKHKDLSNIFNHSGYIEVDEGKLFYQSFGKGKSPASNPIIILHGGIGLLDQTYLLPKMLELADDYELIFYDQRGSGRSLETAIDQTHINLDHFVDDLEKLRLSLGIKKFSLIGHSWGGLIGLNYAISHRESIASLIVINCTPANYAGQMSFIYESMKRSSHITHEIQALFSYETFEKLSAEEINNLYRHLFATAYFHDPSMADQLTLEMSKESSLSGFKVRQEFTKTSWLQPSMDLFPQLKQLQVPTLVIHGNQDVVPVQTAHEIKDAIPNAEGLFLEDCGHYAYIEKPKEVFTEIRSFLTTTSSS